MGRPVIRGQVVRRAAARARSALPRRTGRRALEIVNLAPNPGFRRTGSVREIAVGDSRAEVRLFDQGYGDGGLYVHVHNAAWAADVPGAPGTRGALVAGTDADNDTHVAPGGRDAPGAFRLGMRPGGTYTASVSVYLPAPLTGPLNPRALRIVVGVIQRSAVRWDVARSHPAHNERGDHRISVTFTVPADATAAWLRLVSGMSQGHGAVYWHSLMLTGTPYPVPYFDGHTGGDAFHAVRWLGDPDASPSCRTLRDPAAVAAGLGEGAREAIAAEAARLAAAGCLAEADALVAHLGAGGADPVFHVAAAQVRRARGDEAGAARALRSAVRDGDPAGDAAFQLGLAEERRAAWAPAERRYRAAVAARPTDSVRAYRLARALEKLGRRDDARRVCAEALRHDVGLPFDGPALLARDAKAFGARRDVGVFVAAHLDEIRARARDRLARPAAGSPDLPVFVYWAQGFAAAPPLVRRCLAALRESNPDADIHELTDDTVAYYVDIPPDIVAATAGDRTHFSDLLRLALLERYGGVWLDATCYVSEPLGPRVRRLVDPAGFFAFHYTGPLISSWFLASRPGSYLVHLWRAAMFLWWERRGELIDYFLLHHVFELLHDLDEDFAKEWAAGPRLSSRPPHALQQVMLAGFDRERFAGITAGAFVHKLRYKYDAEAVSSDSYLARLIRRDLPAAGPGS